MARGQGVKWTEREDKFLIDNSDSDLTAYEAGEMLGRSYYSVARRAKKLGVTLRNKNGWSKANKQTLRDNAKEKTILELALMLGRSESAVCAMAYRLDIELMPREGGHESRANHKAEEWVCWASKNETTWRNLINISDCTEWQLRCAARKLKLKLKIIDARMKKTSEKPNQEDLDAKARQERREKLLSGKNSFLYGSWG